MKHAFNMVQKAKYFSKGETQTNLKSVVKYYAILWFDFEEAEKHVFIFISESS